MPCRSDHMEPNAREQANRRAAKLLVWAKTRLGKVVPEYAKLAAKDAYGNGGDRAINELCTLFKQMHPTRVKAFMEANCMDPLGRDCIAWWQEHQVSDAAKAKPSIDEQLGLNVNDKRGGRIIR